MQKRLISALFLLMAWLLISGCYYDVEEELYPATACDTSTVSYATAVSSIIQNNCLGCHSALAAQGNVVLASYNDVKSYGQNGLLLGTIRHDSGFSPMPKGGSKLRACDIKKIEIWINNGYPQ